MKSKEKWLESEDNLLLKLRNKGISYIELLEVFPTHSQDAIRNRYWLLKNKDNNKWIEEERLAFLDIETTGFAANFDYMLSWSLKYLDGEIKHDVITKRDLDKGNFDKRILQSLLKELGNVDTLVTYYGQKFDIPFVRTRAMMSKLEFPAYGLKRHIDLYFSVKYRLKLGRNTLEQATTALGIEGKNHVLGKEWMLGRVGNKEALEYVLEHNDLDVIILEKLYKELLPQCKFSRKSI